MRALLSARYDFMTELVEIYFFEMQLPQTGS